MAVRKREKIFGIRKRSELFYLKHEDELHSIEEETLNRVKIRFESKFIKGEVDKCWNWTGKVYGKEKKAKFSIGNLVSYAPRVSYSLYKGKIGNLLVLHTCDTPSCVNPDHLWLGTDLDNAKDRESKGRGSDKRGEKNGRSKLNELDVRAIKKLLAKGFSRRSIANKWKISIDTIRKIDKGTRWKHIE